MLEDVKYFIEDHKKTIIVLSIMLIVLIILMVFLLKDSSHKVLYNSNQLFYNDKQILIGLEKLPPSEDNIRYTMSVFVRVNNLDGNTAWNEDQSYTKYIINNYGSPNIVYYRDTGMLVVEIAYKSNDAVNEMYEFKLDHFPMQKWIQLCVVVNGRYIELYKNGELFTAKKLDTVPIQTRKMMKIGDNKKNYNGHIGFIDYYNRALNQDEIRKLFKKRIRRLPKEVLTYEQAYYLDNKDIIKGKVDSINKF
jgi:hypothetical protein